MADTIGSYVAGSEIAFDLAVSTGTDDTTVDLTDMDRVASDIAYVGVGGRVVASFTITGLDGSITGIDPELGQCRLTLPASETADLSCGAYYFDVRVERSSDDFAANSLPAYFKITGQVTK